MRIRTIKPEFWVSESVGRISRDARLLFIGLWSFADDSGRGRGALAALSGALFPYDSDMLKKLPSLLDELAKERMVRLYKAEDGNTYYEVLNWLKHQKIEKPSKSKFPPFPERSPNTPRNVGEISPLDQGAGTNGTGTNGDGSCRFAPPSQDDVNFECARIGLPPAEGVKFLAFYASKGWRVGKNPMKDWRMALVGWRTRWEENRQPGSTNGAAHRKAHMAGMTDAEFDIETAEWLKRQNEEKESF